MALIAPPFEVIDSCDSTAGWTGVTLDTANRVAGAGSVKVTSTNAVAVNGIKTTPINLLNRFLCFDYRYDAVQAGASLLIDLDVGNSGYVKVFRLGVDLTKETGTWLTVRRHIEDCTLLNGATLADAANITGVRFRLTGGTGLTLNLWLDRIRALPKTQSAIVSFCFDDATSDQYDNALPVLTAEGVKGTFFATSSWIGTTNRMTAAQINALVAAGHEIGFHGYDHTDPATQSLNAFTDDCVKAEAAIRSYYPKASTYALPLGSALPSQIPMMGQRFSCVRFTDQMAPNILAGNAQKRHNPLPPIDPALTCFMNQSTYSVANITAEIDLAVARGSWLIFLCHAVKASGATGSDTLASTLQSVVQYAKASGARVMRVGDVMDSYTQRSFVFAGSSGGIGIG